MHEVIVEARKLETDIDKIVYVAQRLGASVTIGADGAVQIDGKTFHSNSKGEIEQVN